LKVGSWPLEQLEIALSGRLGLPPGAKAPAFALSVQGARVAMKSFVGRRVLLVFTKMDSHPWQHLLQELNRLQHLRSIQVLLIDTGRPEASKQLVGGGQCRLPGPGARDRETWPRATMSPPCPSPS
jgi:hypothetical protein